MLTYNTMRFGTDEFNVVEDAKTALLVAKEPITTFDYNYIDQFLIDYDQPTGTQIAFAFYLPGTLGKRMCRINPTTGSLVVLNADQGWVFEPNADDVLAYGHSVADLLAMTNFHLSSKLYPVIALKTTGSNVPKVKFGVQVSNRTTKLDEELVRTLFHDGEPYKILCFDHEKEITGSADVTVTAACKDQADGEWSDFGELNSVTDKAIYGLKLKWQMHVDNIDGDKVASKVSYRWTDDVECHAFGDYADIYSTSKNFMLQLKYCSVIVKHSDLSGGAKIKAYAKFDPSVNWKAYTIGTGTGSSQIYSLPVAAFVDVTTFKVYVNGTETTDYRLDVNDNKITITAPEGATITASSNYQLKTEEWIELDADPTQYDISDGKFTTRFSSKITKLGVYVSAIKLRLFRPPRKSDKQLILPITPTGEEQTYTFQSNVGDVSLQILDKDGNLIGNGGYMTEPTYMPYDYDFNPVSHKLTFTVPAGDYQLKAFYSEKADVPIVYSFTAGYCVD